MFSASQTFSKEKNPSLSLLHIHSSVSRTKILLFVSPANSFSWKVRMASSKRANCNDFSGERGNFRTIDSEY